MAQSQRSTFAVWKMDKLVWQRASHQGARCQSNHWLYEAFAHVSEIILKREIIQFVINHRHPSKTYSWWKPIFPNLLFTGIWAPDLWIISVTEMPSYEVTGWLYPQTALGQLGPITLTPSHFGKFFSFYHLFIAQGSLQIAKDFSIYLYTGSHHHLAPYLN